MKTQELTLTQAGAAETGLVPRYWAQQKVAELSLRSGDNREELESVGKHFNLVTPNTSLLVLETAEQYVQYRVVPPKTLPDVYRQFMAKIEQNIKVNSADPIALHGLTQLPNFILRNPDISIGAKTTYSLFLSFAWHNNLCFPGQETLAKTVGSRIGRGKPSITTSGMASSCRQREQR